MKKIVMRVIGLDEKKAKEVKEAMDTGGILMISDNTQIFQIDTRTGEVIEF